jgi:outer membrane lipoprotein-sorting protein
MREDAMFHFRSARWRWAVPAAGAVVVGGVLAGTLIGSASAAPVLAPRTPGQLLADVRAGVRAELTGTVVETASLGLPALPSSAGSSSAGGGSSLYSLLAGSHTVRVWFAGPEHFRLAVPGVLSETDLVRDGSTVWQWQSASDTATRYAPLRTGPAGPPAGLPLTPQQAAREAIAAVRPSPSTAVSTDPGVSVAGQPAYELVLAPKDHRSLIGQVRIAVDAANSVPLRVEVFARGARSPAIQVGYTQVQFTAPAPSELTFTPPPGATVRQGGSPQAPGMPGNDQGFAAIGSGWLTVVKAPASVLTPAGSTTGTAGGLFGPAARVSGPWGSGQLIRTSLISVLKTGNTIYAGAVDPSLLYAAAGHG